VEQVLNLYKTSVVQRARRLSSLANEEEGKAGEEQFVSPRIHALVFDPADGILRKLDVSSTRLLRLRFLV
jgi:hypothetical protein